MRPYNPPSDWNPECAIPYESTPEELVLSGPEVMEFVTKHSINLSVTGSIGQLLLSERDRLRKQHRRPVDMSDVILMSGYFQAPREAIQARRYEDGRHYEGFFVKVNFYLQGARIPVHKETFVLFMNEARLINDGYRLHGEEPTLSEANQPAPGTVQ